MLEVDPPSILYVSIDDMIAVTLSGLSAVPVLLEVRVLRADGVITVHEERMTGPNSRTPTTRQFRLAEGYILSASLACPAPGVARGVLYGMLSLVRSQAPAPTYVYTLTAGYVGTLSPLSYPGLRAEVPNAGGGYIIAIQQAAPAAGTDWSYTPSAGVRQRVQSMQSTLVTSATVANRVVVVSVTQNGFLIYQAASATAQVASTTVSYVFAAGVPQTTAQGGVVIIPLPPGLIINSSTTISTATQALQVGDQWGTLQIGTEDWIDQ